MNQVLSYLSSGFFLILRGFKNETDKSQAPSVGIGVSGYLLGFFIFGLDAQKICPRMIVGEELTDTALT